MANYDDIITKVESLTVVELAELVKKLEEKFGISAAAMAAPAAGGAELPPRKRRTRSTWS
jgi:large subunit ribosomal protein L7/L12